MRRNVLSAGILGLLTLSMIVGVFGQIIVTQKTITDIQDVTWPLPDLNSSTVITETRVFTENITRTVSNSTTSSISSSSSSTSHSSSSSSSSMSSSSSSSTSHSSSSSTTTSSTTTTTTTAAQFPGIEVFAPGCATLGTPDVVNQINENFTGMIAFVESDIVHNYTAIVFLDTALELTGETVYQNGVQLPGYAYTFPAGNVTWTLTPNTNWDAYADDGGQEFLYSPGQTTILSEENMPNYPTDFHATSVMEMVTPTSPISFTIQLGQEFNIPSDIPITSSVGPSPCATAFANSMTSPVQEIFRDYMNGQTEIVLSILG